MFLIQFGQHFSIKCKAANTSMVKQTLNKCQLKRVDVNVDECSACVALILLCYTKSISLMLIKSTGGIRQQTYFMLVGT